MMVQMLAELKELLAQKSAQLMEVM